MPDKNSWNLELSEYIRQGEPERAEKSAAWLTAIGLQAVDGLTTSDYLLATAKEHIEGGIDLPEAKRRIESYYEQRENRKAVEDGTMEADIQSAVGEGVKCKNCTLEELAILRAIAANPAITQKELAAAIGKSERTIKSRTVELQEKGWLRRENGKRNGRWELDSAVKDMLGREAPEL